MITDHVAARSTSHPPPICFSDSILWSRSVRRSASDVSDRVIIVITQVIEMITSLLAPTSR
jgi:hypothetical protein